MLQTAPNKPNAKPSLFRGMDLHKGTQKALWPLLTCVLSLSLSLSWGSAQAADFKACAEAAPGMACVAGGAIKRSDRAGQTQDATVQTFYIDKTEVTNKQFAQCVKAGGCFRHYGFIPKGNLSRPNQPVTMVSWHDAARFCTWAGKRLPTEAEWDHAARAESSHTYSWGNQAPDCKRAHFSGCSPRRPVSALKGSANPRGLLHMVGNVSEWTADWFTPCFKGCTRACGEACGGTNPKGVCQGKLDCTQAWKRVLKGGSWAHGQKKLRVSYRAGMKPQDRGPALGFRCASSNVQIRPPKGYIHMQTRAQVPMPSGPLSSEMKAHFLFTPVDVLKNKKLCAKAGRSYSSCRDPNHYVLSNERRQFLWRRFLQNLGGAHIGIGADQNYNFIVWARSQVAWLMDYDHVIVWIHQLHRAFILKSPTAQEYLTYWEAKNAKKSMALLAEMYSNDPYKKMILRAYDRYRGKIQGSLLRDVKFLKKDPKSKKLRHYWLFYPKNYTYIYTMYKQDRIRLIPGDLLKHDSLKGAAMAAKKMGLTVRTCYLSNAEEVWLFPPTYRNYFQKMPFDRMSVIIRTASLTRWGTKKYGWFHYNLQGALHYQKLVNAKAPKQASYLGYRYSGAKAIMEHFRHRSPIREDLTLIHMPRAY